MSTLLYACDSFLDVVSNVMANRIISGIGSGVDILGHFNA